MSRRLYIKFKVSALSLPGTKKTTFSYGSSAFLIRLKSKPYPDTMLPPPKSKMQF